MKLSTLKKQAQRVTKARGHRLQWGQVFGRADGPKSQHAECRDCHAYLFIAEEPVPNGIGISGLAAAVNCNDR